jgi:hypothetical protein
MADEFRSARIFRAAQGSLPKADQVTGCLFFAASLLVRFFAPLKTGHKHPEGHKGKQRNEQIYDKTVGSNFISCLFLLLLKTLTYSLFILYEST